VFSPLTRITASGVYKRAFWALLSSPDAEKKKKKKLHRFSYAAQRQPPRPKPDSGGMGGGWGIAFRPRILGRRYNAASVANSASNGSRFAICRQTKTKVAARNGTQGIGTNWQKLAGQFKAAAVRFDGCTGIDGVGLDVRHLAANKPRVGFPETKDNTADQNTYVRWRKVGSSFR